MTTFKVIEEKHVIPEIPAVPAVPAQTKIIKKFQCSDCPSVFLSEAAVLGHYAEQHTCYEEVVHLEGYIGDSDDRPTELKGDQVYKFATETGFNAFKRNGKGTWHGPGWYVQTEGFTRCGRCSSSSCGHNWTELVSLDSLHRGIVDHIEEHQKRLRHIRRLLGRKCPECGELGGHSEYGCVEGQIKAEEDLRQVLTHSPCSFAEIVDGKCVECGNCPEREDSVLVPWTQVKQ